MNPGFDAGVSYLRNLTLRRSARSYIEWIGKSVGWWTILYLLFWIVVFTIAGIELLEQLDEPLPIPIGPVLATGATMVFGSLIYRVRAAPVYVNRRDVYRLVLSPAEPVSVLRWPFLKVWLSRGVIGLLIGAVWSLIAPYWLHVPAYFAGPALALMLISLVNLSWIRYWQRNNPIADVRFIILLPVATALSLIGVFLPSAGLTGALVSGNPLSLTAPLLLAVASAVLVHRSLHGPYPPRFAAQSFVLSELSAMRQMNMIAAMAGVQGFDDPAYRQRLLATLHDKPGVTRPRYHLRPPRPDAPQWKAIAWRTWLMLLRRPLLAQARLLLQLVFIAFGIVFVPQLGSFGLLLMALVMGNLAGFTLGAGGYARYLPLSGTQRTLGRALPALVMAGVAGLGGWLLLNLFSGGAAGTDVLLLLIVILLSVVLWLEKYSTWVNTSAGRLEAWGVAALLATAPALLLDAFGAPALIFPVQAGVLGLLLILDS